MKNKTPPRVPAGRQGADVPLKTENGQTTFNMLERPMLDPMATVVVVEFEGARFEK